MNSYSTKFFVFIKMAKNHPYHILPLSPWPIVTSLSLLLLVLTGFYWMHQKHHANLLFPFACMFFSYSLYKWWKSVIHEGLVEKHHNNIVQQGLRIGMGLFIFSEIMFFAAVFASFFYFSFNPADLLQDNWSVGEGFWPPKNLELPDAWNLPLMNTLILLLSGTTVTWSHQALLENKQKDAAQALLYTVILGLSFTVCQAIEYHHIIFKLADGAYPSNFYLATGFHGAHVIMGTIFLLICYFRTINGHFATPNSYLGFEFAAWYWHFIDVVWLFLFAFMYVLV